MIDSDEFLAVGAALINTVRSYIKYSENINTLYEGYRDSYIYKKRRQQVQINYYGLDCDPIEQGKEALEQGIGYCYQLSLACLYIAQGLDEIKLSEDYYISWVATDNHAFIIIHQTKPHSLIYKNFEALLEDEMFNNAVIVDPWIYKATKLSEYQNHFDHAELYNVIDFYQTKINFKTISIHVSMISELFVIEGKYIDTFHEFYTEQLDKLDNMKDLFSIGRRFSSVRRSLEYNMEYEYKDQEVIDTQKKNQILSFIEFLTSISKKSSSWYSNSFRSDRKNESLKRVIEYLDKCITRYNYPNNYTLELIFWRVIAVCAIVRGNKIPNGLSINNIHMTSTALGIFDLNVTPEEILPMEDIDGISLDWVRRARNDLYNHRILYRSYLEQLNLNIPSFNLENLYNDKRNYYNLLAELAELAV